MAGRIPQDFIDDLLARTDLGEVIGNRVQLKQAGREFKACCPFHNEKSPSFTVSPDKGFYHCFGCGAHGTALGFLMEYDKLDFVEAIEELASIAGVDVPREQSDAPQTSNTPVYDLLDEAAGWFQGQLKPAQQAVDYLKSRGLEGTTAQRFMLGFAPDGWDNLLNGLASDPVKRETAVTAGLLIRNEDRIYDRFRNRIIFPIRDPRGRVIGFGGRTMDKNDGAKYLNSPETPVFHKGRELYGLYELRQAVRKIDSIIVVEGYMDVISLAQHDVPNSVATLGTATTIDHLKRLFRLTQDIVFCFDGDRAGRQAAWRALQTTLPEMRDGRQVRFLFLPDGEDPDTIARSEGAEGFKRRLAASQSLSDYLLQELESQTDMNSVDGRARLAELAKPLLQRLPDGIYRDLLQQKLASEVGMSADRLGQHIGEAPAEPVRAPTRRPQAQRGKRSNTPVRQAIRIIMHYPEQLSAVEVPEGLSSVDLPGVDLLLELLKMIRGQETPLTSGMLIQRFQDRPEREPLEKLQGQAIPPMEKPAIELADILRNVAESPKHLRLAELTEKIQMNTANSDEINEYQALMTWKRDAQRAPAEPEAGAGAQEESVAPEPQKEPQNESPAAPQILQDSPF